MTLSLTLVLALAAAFTPQMGAVPQCESNVKNCPAAQTPAPARVPLGAKLFVADMNGFEGEMRDALTSTPLVNFVDSRDQADYIVTGWVTLEKRHRGLLYYDLAPIATASMTVTAVKSGDEVYRKQIQVREAEEGTRDAAKKLAKAFFAYLSSK